jgi:biotin carboxyl carrier protein
MTAVDSPRLLPAPAATPRGPRRSEPPMRRRRSWAAWLVLVLVIAGAGYGGYHLVQQRLAGAALLALDDVTLVADPIAVGSPDAAVVTSVAVAPGGTVTAGTEVAVIELAVGGGLRERVTLTAPVDGNVVRIDAQPGSVVRAGEAVVTLYDPGTLTFRTELAMDSVERLETGMEATIDGPGLSTPVTATVTRVVPLIDPAGAESEAMTVILQPRAASSVVHAVPGVPLSGTLDTTTGSTGTSVLETGA